MFSLNCLGASREPKIPLELLRGIFKKISGPVAQLAEQLTHNQRVGGSSPSGPIFKDNIR